MRCIATVGLGNALRAKDPPGPAPPAGTINLLVWSSAPLGEGAALEVLALAVGAVVAEAVGRGIGRWRAANSPPEP